jgi:long-chain acyl-CoA synthetase
MSATEPSATSLIGCSNLTELHRRQAERLGARPALRFKRYGLYHDVTWQAYRADALACAAALVAHGIQPGDRVGLLAENRLEWLIADMGILAAVAVNVPPHAPLTARQIQFQLDHAEVRWLFVSTREQLAKLAQFRRELSQLEGIVLFDALELTSLPPDVFSWAGFLQQGRLALPSLADELKRREKELGPDDLATIMYTSGTTGNPKGVMLTHQNLLSNALASLELSSPQPEDVCLNWLPFSHIYARTVDHYMNLASGTVVCLAESAETILQNIKDVQPTHVASVPRFYEKVLTAVQADHRRTDWHSVLRRQFGSRIRHLTSGGAPLPRPIAEAYQAAELPLYQGYGLTESSPVISFNCETRNKLCTVGPPIPGVEVAIAPDGEVLTRGPHVMKGYWKDPVATAAAIRNGWLYTGDLGELDADGFLSITGRKKDLMVLSNGKKVVPAYLEGLLLGDECIDQVVVCGEGRNFLTALVVPHWDNVRRVLREEGVSLDHQGTEELSHHPAVCRLLQQRMGSALANVSSCEQVKKFLILPRPFTVAAEELTVSLKLRRNVVLAKYADRLAALYQEQEPCV